MTNKGLTRQDCTHEESRWEWRGVSWGEEEWLCMDCGETLLRPLDCPGR